MIQKLKGFIAIGKSSEAINIMANVLAEKDREQYNELILLSGRVARNQSLFAQNLMELDDYRKAEAQCNFALLSIIDSMDPDSFLEKKETEKPVQVDTGDKTKLLFIASQPADKPYLKLEKEYLEIRKIFKKYRHLYQITEEFDATIDTFFESIHEQNPHIIHFSGYGDDGCVALSRSMDRTTHTISYEYLAPAFKLMRGNTECVFFNTQGSCLFAKVISRFIPFAIGIQGVVNDEDAISFSSGFYSALAIEKNYKKAFEFGKKLFEAGKAEKNNALSPTKKKTVEASLEHFEEEEEEEDMGFERLTGDTDSCSDCNYYLYINGFCEEDTTTPDDFYMPGKTDCSSGTR